MKLNVLKKLSLVLFIFVTMFVLADGINFSKLQANDFNDTISWKGHDLGFTPQMDVNYESQYVPFEMIIDDVMAIDMTKTYVIQSAYDLYMFSQRTRGIHRSYYLALDYVLGRNIDYYEIVQQNISNRFIPIGFIEPFSGTFDGQGYEITNLFFQSILSEESYNDDYPGLRFFSMFSRVSSTGVVKNLGLINPIIIQPIEWGIMDHVSYVIGENFGLVENIYVIDRRMGTAGLNVEGSFRLSGLVSINRGIFRNSYIATPRVKSSAVVINQSVSPVMYLNLGTLQNVYYDASIYVDEDALLEYGTPLTTAQFQSGNILSSDWFFNNHYVSLVNGGNTQQVTLNNTYPRLQGLSVSSGKLLIENAVDFVYFNELLKVSGAFRSAHYEIIADIDMNQVATTAYQAASVGFDGKLTSAIINGNKLYQRDPNQGGDINYYTILNLKITTPTEIGNFTSYALFASLFGRVENINFVNLNIETSDITNQVSKSKILVGAIAAQMSNATISNVHVQGNIIVTPSSAPMTRLYVGGLVAEGSGGLHKVSTHGQIQQSVQVYGSNAADSVTAGMVAYTQGLKIEKAYQAMDITGLSFTTLPAGKLYLGGVVGYGKITTLDHIVQAGYLMSHLESGFIGPMMMGGIIAEQTDQRGMVRRIFNDGNMDVFVNNPMSLSLASYGYVHPSQASIDSHYAYESITNNGRLRLVTNQTFTNIELQNFDIKIAGIMRTSEINASFQGIYNERSFTSDLSLISRYAGLLDIGQSTESTVKQAYHTGDITLQSTQGIVHQDMRFAGLVLGQNISYEHLRNEGNITLNFGHASNQSSGTLYVYGAFETVSQNQQAKDIYNGGDLSVTSSFGMTNPYQVFVSGITHQNSDTNLYQRENINHQSIEQLTHKPGSLHNVLNAGDLTISGRFNGSTRAAGILMINESMLTQAINLGHVFVDNELQLSTGELAAAGIAYLHAGAYAQTIDAANYGQIESKNLTSNGFSHAAGIVLRNDLTVSLSVISIGSTSKFSKVMFSINYGDIYAYHGLNESTYTITQETRSKASGIFGIGLSTVMNTINYGNVYGNTLASGIFGFMYYNRFGVIQANQVYIANNINYGVIRQITNYATDYVINHYDMPVRQSYLAFGAIIGKVHTGLSSWEFISLSPTVDYAWDLISWGYHLSFDPMADILGNNPSTTVSNWLAYNASSPTNDPTFTGNDIVLSITSKFATVKVADTSLSPLNSKVFGGPPRPVTYGAPITSYAMNDSTSGIYNLNYIFRQLPARSSGTDQYLRNYFTYVESNRTNPELVQKIESNTWIQYLGLYVLSNREGISNGVFIPNHLHLTDLSPINEFGQRDFTWLGSTLETESISYKIQVKMQQILQEFASSIYELELVQQGVQNGLTLNQPVIDEARSMITYYLPSNTSIINHLTSQSIQTSTFIEASEGVPGVRKVPDYYDNVLNQWVYHYVGQYQRVGNDYISIGAYGTGGQYHLSFTYFDYTLNTTKNGVRTIYNANNANEARPAYTPDLGAVSTNIGLSLIYTHVNHVRQNLGSSGNFYLAAPSNANFRAFPTNTNPLPDGTAPYRLVTYSVPAQPDAPYYINGTYQYAGANKTLVTYVSAAGDYRTVYQSTTISFGINTDQAKYRVSSGASLSYQGMSMTENVTIPRSVGVYDLLYDYQTNALIDSFENHYGSVRVFSTAYNQNNPATFKDYQVRIVRTANQSFDALNSVYVDGQIASPAYSNFRQATVSSSQPVHFERSGQLGSLTVSYRILNAPDYYDIKPFTKLYRHQTNETVDEDLYDLERGFTNNPSSFNNLTGAWGFADVTMDLWLSEAMESGTYRLEITLITGEVVYVVFTKKESSNGFIIDMVHQEDKLVEELGVFHSTIPYGLFYDATDPKTQGVNFTNLNSLQMVLSQDIELGQRPSYLNDFMISPYATLISVELSSITKINGLYVYQIDYVIEAEDGTSYPYTHYLTERMMSQSPLVIYKDGGQLDDMTETILVRYNDAPTIRVELELANAYIPSSDFLNYEVIFTPLNGGDALLNQDYFIHYIDGIGYQLDLTRNTPIGLYDVVVNYASEITLWQTELSWSLTFDTLSIEKLQNDQSKLVNAYFVSDQLFSGFNTIVDIEEPTEQTYLAQLMNPELRKMSVLPTTGIFYGVYASYDTFWIIGQVQRTNLTAYAPQFELPDNAIIRRVVNPNEVGPEFQSTNLFADFSLQDDVFNFIQYRVYAQDYQMNPNNYTDYYIAVQDVTNNIKFNLTVVNNTDTHFDRVHTRVNICRVPEEEVCDVTNYLFQMSVFSYYDLDTDSYSNNQFQTSQMELIVFMLIYL